VLGRAGEEGQRRRLEAARDGKVTWLPPPNLGAPVSEEEKKRIMEKKKAAALLKKQDDLGNEERNRAKSYQSPLGDFDDF